ncbi:MAG: RNA polymerase sigma factor [bacterium]|nr:RNA polymerase sigma factor [bacterium]
MDDHIIISEVLAGDKEKYRLIMERYQTRLVNFIFAMTSDEDEANDIAQIAFIKAYKSLKNYNSKYKFSTWLYQIAINTAKTQLKKKRPISLDEVGELSTNENISLTLAKKDEHKLIVQAVNNLDDNYRLVVNMYYWQDLNYQQIADIMKVPLGTIKTWIARAKQKLKEQLDGQI